MERQAETGDAACAAEPDGWCVMTQQAKTPIQEFACNVGQNAWDWDIWEFAKRCKLDDPGNGVSGEHTAKQFKLFNQLHNVLREIDNSVLDVIGLNYREAKAPEGGAS